MHAMPLMIGVLCCLAIAYRYLQRVSGGESGGARRLASRRPTAYHDGQNYHPTQQLGAVRPSLRGHLRRGAADWAGAGDSVRLLAGPDLARDRRVPGRRGAGHAGAGRQRAARRPSLAEIARTEIGRVAGIAASIAILFVVIVALAGLGHRRRQGPRRRRSQTGGGHRAERCRKMRRWKRRSDGARDYASCRRARKSPTQRRRSHAQRSVHASPVPNSRIPPRLHSAADGGKLTLPAGVAQAVPGSSWGTFTIACTIPIALFVGLYMYKLRKGQSRRSVAHRRGGDDRRDGRGAIGFPARRWNSTFHSRATARSGAICIYGFIASVLPVWMLLCPRDYLSSFLKIGTIVLLVVAVIVANPKLQAPAVNQHLRLGGGPNFDGPIFPFCSSASCAGRSPGFTRWSPRAPRRR